MTDNLILMIGDCEVWPDLDQIRRDGQVTKVEPRTMRLLLCLAEHAGEVVSVQQLLESVWKDVVVTHDSVYTAIASLRRTLGDDGAGNLYIQNVPRRGYSLVAPVRREAARGTASAAPGSRARWPYWSAALVVVGALAALALYSWRGHQSVAGAAPPIAPERSIAVLPFVDLSERHDQQYFSDGLAEELIGQLTRITSLRVLARTSSFHFRGSNADVPTIARQLRVANVLEGSVRRVDNQVRVTADLIQADTGYHLWSQSYDRDMKDIFKVQDDIARMVVAALRLKLESARQLQGSRSVSPEAYLQYLAGRQSYQLDSLEGNQRAIEAYDRAIAIEPNYAGAYAGRAMAERDLSDATGDATGRQRAADDAGNAVALAPDQPEGYLARSYLRRFDHWDWQGAREDMDRALAIDPNSAEALRLDALLKFYTGHASTAIAAARRAVEVDPLSANPWHVLGISLAFGRFPAEALDAFQKGLAVDASNPFLLYRMAVVHLTAGQAAAALDVARRNSDADLRLALSAMALHSLGRRAESDQALHELTEKSAADSAYQIAEVHAWRGEADLAFAWLSRAVAQMDGGLAEIQSDPIIAGIRNDPRYAALLRQLNFRN
jgi:TolB-like protein/DNA-binding winged helix-turn-helix (wHTH) protein